MGSVPIGEMAKSVAKPSILLSTLGVIFTSGLTGLLCFFIFKTTLLEGLLIGAIVGSTDAASVFAILRSQRLNLKGSIASMLELEKVEVMILVRITSPTTIILMLISNNNNENNIDTDDKSNFIWYSNSNNIS